MVVVWDIRTSWNRLRWFRTAPPSGPSWARRRIADDGGVTATTYDGQGRVHVVSDPRGKVRSHIYNHRGHVVEEQTAMVSTGTPTKTLTLGTHRTFDDEGRVIGETTLTGTPIASYEYDAWGFVKKRTDANSNSVDTCIDYDDDGRVERIAHDGGTTHCFVPGLHAVPMTEVVPGQAQTLVKSAVNSHIHQVFDYDRDDAGNPLQTTYTDSGWRHADSVEDYTYDVHGRLTAIDRAGGRWNCSRARNPRWRTRRGAGRGSTRARRIESGRLTSRTTGCCLRPRGTPPLSRSTWKTGTTARGACSCRWSRWGRWRRSPASS